MAENISKIILNGTEYVIKDAATQYHTINGQSITGGTGDITITGGSGLKKWEGTRAEYNALSSYDADTLYIITDEDVQIPTKTSELTNDSGFITGVDLSNYATTATTSDLQSQIHDRAKTSDVTNALAKKSNTGHTHTLSDITDYSSPDLSSYAKKADVNTSLAGKQDTLVSGTNVKTINGQSLLGSGDIATVPVTTDNVNYTNSSSTKTLTQVLNNTEEITFTLEDGSTVTKKFILG